MMKKDKRGVLGLDTTKAVLVLLLTLGVLVVVTFLVLGTLQTAQESVDTNSASVTNETVTTLNDTIGDYLTYHYLRNVVCTVSKVINVTSGGDVPATNYTITNCLIKGNAGPYLNQNVKVTYTYTYDQPYADYIVTNMTSGSGGFFSYVPTFFILLAVVVLILIIAVVIIAVSRFRSEGSSIMR